MSRLGCLLVITCILLIITILITTLALITTTWQRAAEVNKTASLFDQDAPRYWKAGVFLSAVVVSIHMTFSLHPLPAANRTDLSEITSADWGL